MALMGHKCKGSPSGLHQWTRHVHEHTDGYTTVVLAHDKNGKPTKTKKVPNIHTTVVLVCAHCGKLK